MVVEVYQCIDLIYVVSKRTCSNRDQKKTYLKYFFLMAEQPSDLGVCAVTGSSGWFASSLVSQLTQNGYTVHCLDIQEANPIDENINPYCKINNKLTKFYKCDITKYDQVLNALQNVDTVFHVCAITDIRLCPSDYMTNVNVNGTANVLKACKHSNIKQFVYTSSIEAINDGTIKDQAKEDLKWVTNYNAYGTTKTLAEKLILKSASNNSNTAVSILRLAHIYGPGDPIIFSCVNMAVNIGDGICKHSFIYIENCAFAHIQTAKALASKSKRLKCNKQIFNIKDHDCNFIKWYREILCEKANMRALYIPYTIALILAYIYDFVIWILFKLFGLRIGDPIETFGVLAVEAACKEHTYNVDKFDEFVGYKPEIDLKESIRRTRDWRKRKYPKKII
eukprot:274591_1